MSTTTVEQAARLAIERHPNVLAVVPVKNLDQAKLRLTDALGPAERFELAQRLLDDLLAALQGSSIASTLVVTADETASRIAERRSCGVLLEEATGLNRALEQAASRIQPYRVPGLLILPIDLPLVTPQDIDALLEAHQLAFASGPGVSVVTDRHRDGTNALLMSPSGAIPFGFGSGSADRHMDSAKECGVPCQLVESSRLAIDLDTIEDLLQLMSIPADGPTSSALRFLESVDLGGLQTCSAEASCR